MNRFGMIAVYAMIGTQPLLAQTMQKPMASTSSTMSEMHGAMSGLAVPTGSKRWRRRMIIARRIRWYGPLPTENAMRCRKRRDTAKWGAGFMPARRRPIAPVSARSKITQA